MDRFRRVTVQLALRPYAAVAVGLVAWINTSSASPKTTPPAVLPGEPSSTAAPTSSMYARLVFADPFPSQPAPLPKDLLPAAEPTSSAWTQFLMGALAEEEGRPEEAFEAFRQSLSLDPGNAALAGRIAATWMARENSAEALRVLKDAHQANPKAVEPLVQLAQIYLRAPQRNENAFVYAERAYKLAPDQLSVLSTFLDACSAMRQTQRVEEALKRTLSFTNKDAAFWIEAGELFRNILLSRQDHILPSVLERNNQFFQKAMDAAPTDPRILERSADHYALTAQFAQACRLYEHALGLARQSQSPSAPGLSVKWAKTLVLSEQPAQAAEILEGVLKEDPANQSGRKLLGELYLQQGQLILALGHLQTALVPDASELNDYTRVIQLQLRLHRASDAARTAAEARGRFPNTPGLTLLHAVSLSDAKQHAEAVKAFEEAERQFLSAQVDGLDAGFYLTYGAAAERAGLPEQAARLLQKSISLDPENAAEPMNYLGFMWIERNQNLEEAGKLIEQALKLRPGHPAYLDSLGWWYYRKGDFPAAEREIRRALEKIRREDASEVYDHLGDTLEKRGQYQEAVAAWENALAIDPHMPGVSEKIKRFQSPPAVP